MRLRQQSQLVSAPKRTACRVGSRRTLLALLGMLTAAPVSVAASALPHLVISVEKPPGPATASENGPVPAAVSSESPQSAAARLQLGEVSARAELEFDAWPLPLKPGLRPRIGVEMKKGDRLFGLHRYSLVDPAVVGYQGGPLIAEQLRRQGVLAPRIRFARVTLNGTSLGVMAVRERPSKELLESQKRRDGVLFRLKREVLPVARMRPYRRKKVSKSERLTEQRDTAAGLFQAFLRGELSADQVFDVELVARFLAVAELWRAEASLRPENLRFYFNPITQRLEPVAHNAVLNTRPDAGEPLLGTPAWSQQLLADDSVAAATRRRLRVLADELARPDALESWTAEEADLLTALGGVGAAPARIDFGAWIARARRLADVSAAAASPRGVGGDGDHVARRRLLADPETPSLERNPVPTSDLASALKRHPFLRWDAANNSLRAEPGTWTLGESLVLPAGIGLDLEAGTTLRFPPTGLLLATGPLRFHGSEAAPVVLEGIPVGTGAGSWQGLVALDSSSPHVWEHVLVQNTTGIDRGVWSVTAGVTLRTASVRMTTSTIRGNRTEDALNLIRSNFDFDGVAIVDASSDAFDCDFCVGRLRGGNITGVGGDGIDVSGSAIEVVGVEIAEVRDKAISVGEGSRLRARDVRIRSVGTAVAGKDGSEVIFEDSEVSDVHYVAIMAYTKKREYGPGRVIARNVRMSGVGRTAVAQLGSRIDIDGVVQLAEDLDIDNLYSQGYMKK